MKDNSLSNVDIQIIRTIDKKILFPLSEDIVSDMKSNLQTQAKVRRTNRTPKPMNKFLVFRRCLNHVVKKSLPYDGKNLSRVAAHIWKEATMEEKQCYVDLTKLLKEQHSKIYPNHIEKRNRKHHFNFVYYDKNYKSPNQMNMVMRKVLIHFWLNSNISRIAFIIRHLKHAKPFTLEIQTLVFMVMITTMLIFYVQKETIVINGG
ncbi:hypothetical protein C1646_691834 [Rhizophagus diaphanus]|nr:hypothetical protein C1646_691834 [Rhizophagus diaphanus] [Rhizophagus sp. MUCL 43196]